MIGLAIRKWFYDYWDNFLHFLIINVLVLLSALIPFGISPAIVQGAILASQTANSILSLAVFILGLLWLGVLCSAASLYVNEIAQFRKAEPRKVGEYFRRGLAWGLLYAGLWGLAVFLVLVVLPFYSSLQNFFGIFAMALVFWSLLFLVLSLQYFFPIVAQLDQRPWKVLKKMFIIMYDNFFFSLFMALFSLLVIFLSGFTAFLFLGPASTLLLGQVAFRLRMYKYDYLEEHPPERPRDARRIPWQALVAEDRDLVGRRSLRSLIFPWKD